jgi:hypothetical protein
MDNVARRVATSALQLSLPFICAVFLSEALTLRVAKSLHFEWPKQR